MNTESVVVGTTANWKNEVEDSKVPVLVDFWAAWCGPCRMVSPVIDQLAKKHAGKVKVVKLNVDENQEIAMRFNIMSIPTIMLFNNGKEVDQVVGAGPPDLYEQLLANNVTL